VQRAKRCSLNGPRQSRDRAFASLSSANHVFLSITVPNTARPEIDDVSNSTLKKIKICPLKITVADICFPLIRVRVYSYRVTARVYSWGY